MTRNGWLFALVVALAVGLIATGCGGDDDDGDTEEPAVTQEAITEEDADDADPGERSGTADPDAVYEACLDLIRGTPAEDAAQSACESARDTLEQCLQTAESIDELGDESARDKAIESCEDAADQALAALEGAS